MNRRWTANGYERRCGRCRVWHPEDNDHFAYNSRRDVFNSWCKPCASEYSRNRNRRPRPRPAFVASPASQIGRGFGLEVEFIGDRYALQGAMRAEGLECAVQDYNHRVQSGWKIVPDGSVHAGAELVSPILRGEDGVRQIKAASRALRAAGCTTNRTTGLHVHHDVQDLSVEAFRRLVTNWFHSQTAIDALVSPSRRNNYYCRPLTSYDLGLVNNLSTMERYTAAAQLRGDRYKSLNFQSYGKYGTVEVRQHQGTTDARKILAWVEFTRSMVEAAKNGATMDALNVMDALQVNGLTVETHRYLTTRRTRIAARSAR